MKKPSKTKSNRARLTQWFQQEAAEDWVSTAYDCFASAEFQECENAARKALRCAPGHYRATLLLADLLAFSGRLREVPRLVQEAARKHPNEPMLHFILADAASELGRLPDARRAILKFRELVERDPDKLGRERAKLLARARAILRQVERQPASREVAEASAKQAVEGGSPAARALQGSLFDASGPITARRATQPLSEPRRGRKAQAGLPGRVASPPQTTAARAARDRTPAARVGPGGAAGAGADREPGAAAARGTSRRSPDPAHAAQVVFRVEKDPGAQDWLQGPWSDDLDERELLLEAQRITLLSQYEELLSLPTLNGVERLEYQVETARKILRRLSGRALLCDEVGLGKTIEAGMVIKEYLLRGLARSVLVLVPPGLVQQWQDEMSQKFGLEFALWGEKGRARRSAPPEGNGSMPLLAIGSIALARLKRNFESFAEKEWDLVVVDEAHHLRRRGTRSWALVNSLRKRYLLLLSATPVHNNLMELYELVTLVRPGLLGTPAEFRRKFLSRKEGRGARNPEQLRDVLAEVMVRNTRSHADVALPRRFATTLVLQPQPAEALAYRAASDYARLSYSSTKAPTRVWLRHLLGCAGSGPRAVAEMAARKLDGARVEVDPQQEVPSPVVRPPSGSISSAPPGARRSDTPAAAGEERRLLRRIIEAAESAGDSTKAKRLLELLSSSDEQVVVFCRYRATLGELSALLANAGVAHAVYHGGLARREKDAALEAFRDGARVLLSTESGGEGRNIQFCRTIVNYDLPWDPMLIEQRIGRVHRIGQQRDVFVFNLVLAGTLEEELIRILEEKIHLFELIVGEVDAILGHLERREEFANILLDLWAGARDEAERRTRFEAFGKELAASRSAYEKQKELDDSLFADELEV
ncbi:MAG: SNF2-related protein [Candidatus Krumholzibacteriia bacterium]